MFSSPAASTLAVRLRGGAEARCRTAVAPPRAGGSLRPRRASESRRADAPGRVPVTAMLLQNVGRTCQVLPRSVPRCQPLYGGTLPWRRAPELPRGSPRLLGGAGALASDRG